MSIEDEIAVCAFCERTLPAKQVKVKDGAAICGGCEALERGYYK